MVVGEFMGKNCDVVKIDTGLQVVKIKFPYFYNIIYIYIYTLYMN